MVLMAYYKPSLGSKVFHGVVDQRKEQHSWCFARTKNGVRATKRKMGWGRGRRPFLCSHPIFCTGKTIKILFLDPQPLRNTCCTGYYKPYKLIYSCLTISTCIEISLPFTVHRPLHSLDTTYSCAYTVTSICALQGHCIVTLSVLIHNC